jgi:phosphohistidine phosphatase
MGLRVAEVRHSGKLRAEQTAEILAECLSPPQGVRAVEGLCPLDDLTKAWTELEAAREPLILVGHLPHLSRLASALTVGDPAKEVIQFQTGAMVCLVKREAGWAMSWILTSELAG